MVNEIFLSNVERTFHEKCANYDLTILGAICQFEYRFTETGAPDSYTETETLDIIKHDTDINHYLDYLDSCDATYDIIILEQEDHDHRKLFTFIALNTDAAVLFKMRFS